MRTPESVHPRFSEGTVYIAILHGEHAGSKADAVMSARKNAMPMEVE
jgi:hypothetical protein